MHSSFSGVPHVEVAALCIVEERPNHLSVVVRRARYASRCIKTRLAAWDDACSRRWGHPASGGHPGDFELDPLTQTGEHRRPVSGQERRT